MWERGFLEHTRLARYGQGPIFAAGGISWLLGRLAPAASCEERLQMDMTLGSRIDASGCSVHFGSLLTLSSPPGLFSSFFPSRLPWLGKKCAHHQRPPLRQQCSHLGNIIGCVLRCASLQGSSQLLGEGPEEAVLPKWK